MSNNLSDLTLLLEVLEAAASERAVDLKSVDKGGDSHEAVGLDILVELVGSGLVEDDGVLGLVLDCNSRKCQSQRFRSCLRVVHRAAVRSVVHRAQKMAEVGLTLSLGPLLLLLLSTSRCGSHFE